MKEKKDKLDLKIENWQWENHCNQVAFNTDWDRIEKWHELKEATISLPVKVEFPRATAIGRLRQLLRRLRRKAILRRNRSLFDIAITHSLLLSRAWKHAKDKSWLPPELTTVEITHRILSEEAEEYTIVSNHQERQFTQLKLQLFCSNESVKIRITAPCRIWARLSLEEPCDYMYLAVLTS